ncbi:response regulator [Alkalicoccobacillus porphyridii]|uniref:Response regulator n=1 Tax=Alkalicoccobacillus porphyridii TaxID=2597270 RepID=A0A554A352_9BACI|nr:response regulator [Alkalicoccobacillus porphyridii]TSB48124.1 response regulator [Alkalicoccobacillus porphyridii]
MYKVLLVDDEVNILEGIAALVNWKACGTQLIGKAGNGLSAFEQIQEKEPDIVITDIKMPGLNGIELIKRVHPLNPKIKWIILSGHDEFEFAKTAMEHEVKHYLLKPSNEQKIEEALKQVTTNLDKQKQDEDFVLKMKNRLHEILPKARTQVLKEVLSDNTFGAQEWGHFQHLFGSDDIVAPLKLIVMIIDEPEDRTIGYQSEEFEHFYALKEMATYELQQVQTVLLSTTIGEKVVILIESCPDQQLISTLKEVKQHFNYFYQLSFTSAISSENNVTHLRQLFREALQSLAQRFYIGEGGIISTGSLDQQPFRFDELQFNHEELLVFIRSGNKSEVQSYLDHYFSYVAEKKYDVSIVKAHSLELYTSIIRQASNELMNELFKEVTSFQRLNTFNQIEEFLKEAAQKVTSENYTSAKKHLSTTIHNVCEYVESHYDNTDVSLSQLSNDVFYMNSDYLGKLFKKEIGEKFSHYLMKLRISKAVELIETSDDIKVADIAEMVGFGNNPRYFSQVFKKQIGFTPSEYKEVRTS